MISVLITSYNRPDTIKETIDSILTQTYDEYEIIISDDSSPKYNQIEQVVKRFNNKKIKLIKTTQNLGFLKNLKYGFKKAKGDYIFHISDDDVLLDNRFFEKCIKIFTNMNDIDIVIGKIATIVNKSIFPVSKFHITKKILENREMIQLYYNLIPTYSLGSCLSRKNVFEFLFDLPDDSRYFDELTFFNIISNARKGYFLDDLVMAWRITPDSRANSDLDNLAELSKLFLTVPLYLYDKYGLKYKEMINNYILERLEWIFSNYHISKNDEKFNFLIKKYKLKGKNIYLYGKSEVGINLKDFLESKNLNFKYFIDDVRKANDVIGLNKIEDNNENVIIITTYKPRIVLKIYKKIILKFKNLKVIELLNL